MKETQEIQKFSIEAIRVQEGQICSIHLVFKQPVHTAEEASVAYFANKMKSLLSVMVEYFLSSYVYVLSTQVTHVGRVSVSKLVIGLACH